MADGTTKAIADIRVGDRVEAADPETGERGGRRVVASVIGEGHKHLVDASVGGATVTATAGHPFWLADESRWADAAALRAGDVLLSSDGGRIRVGAVAARAKPHRVHNLTVEGLHNGHAILTHNCSRPKDGGLAGAPNTAGGGSVALPNIPEGATVRVLKPSPPGGAQYGVEYKWTTSQGQTARFRVHGPDATAPAGSNAASGEVYRYQIGSRYIGPDGTLHPSGISNPKSPFYDPVAANETHIPWPGFPQLWGGG